MYGAIALASFYLVAHLLSHGPLLIYRDQWRGDGQYSWSMERPPVPEMFRLGPAIWAIIFLSTLFLADFVVAGTTSPQELRFSAVLVIGRVMYGLIDNRETRRPRGWSLKAVATRVGGETGDTVTGVIMGRMARFLVVLLAYLSSLVPILGAPLPKFLSLQQREVMGEGLPILLVIVLVALFMRRWSSYLKTLGGAKTVGRADHRHLLFHWLCLPAYAFLILHMNTLFALSYLDIRYWFGAPG